MVWLELIRMLADSEIVKAPSPSRSLCLACSALGWGDLVLGGLLAGIHCPSHTDLQVPARLHSISAQFGGGS